MSTGRRAPAPGLALAYSLALLGDQMLYVFLPSAPEAAGITAADLGIVLSANRLVRLGANSLGGVVSDRVGRRAPYLVGMALALVSTAGYLASRSLGPLLASRVLWGVAFALISVGGVAIMLDRSTSADRGRTIGRYQSMLQFGTLVGLVLSGVLTDLIGYRGTLAVYAPLAGVGLLIAAAVLRRDDSRGSPPLRPAGTAFGQDGGVRTSAGPPPATLAALRGLDRWLAVPAAVTFASLFTGSGIVMAMLGVHLRRLSTEASGDWLVPVASLTGLLLAVRRLAGMVLAPLVGHALDRWKDRRAVAGAGVAVSLAGFVVLASGGRVGAVIVGVVLVAMGEAVIHPAVTVWAGDHAPAHLRGVVMGGLATAGDLGAALGPLVGYAMLESAGLGSAYTLCAGLLVAALVLLASMPAPERGRP